MEQELEERHEDDQEAREKPAARGGGARQPLGLQKEGDREDAAADEPIAQDPARPERARSRQRPQRRPPGWPHQKEGEEQR